MSRKKRGFQQSNISCGYKSIKISDSNLIKRFDNLCRIKDCNWEQLTTEAIREYLKNHENDDLEFMNREELKEIIRQYRIGKYS